TLTNGVAGAALDQPNAYVKFDFGSAATRKVSLYAMSSQGPCAMAIGGNDSIAPWDRSDTPSMFVMADSYGQVPSANFRYGGLFFEAAMRLGITTVDLSAIGGTGYAPNSVFTNAGDAFDARIGGLAQAQPDLFVTAGGINDNNWLALPPYATADEARIGFDNA